MMLLLLALLSSPLPNPTLTPGAVRNVTQADICVPGYAKKIRAVSQITRRAAFKRYGLTPSAAYELDHLIPLELGGSNTLANLWPQPYAGPLNAHTKDVLENRLHVMVCTHYLNLSDAQQAIAKDWVAALKTYGVKP